MWEIILTAVIMGLTFVFLIPSGSQLFCRVGRNILLASSWGRLVTGNYARIEKTPMRAGIDSGEVADLQA
jgi:hypothetical protein